MRNKILPLLLVLSFICGCDCLQTVNGVVKDAATDQIIAGAVVFKVGDETARDTTDTNGFFQISDVTRKQDCPYMQVTVEKDGYVSQTVSIPSDGETEVLLGN